MQVLDLSQNAELSDDGVARLSTLGALTSLNLSGASQVRLVYPAQLNTFCEPQHGRGASNCDAKFVTVHKICSACA